MKENALYEDNVTAIERWLSMFIDHLVICLTIPFSMTIITEYDWIVKSLIAFLLGIHFNKDGLNGQSIGKRILGQVVIDIKTGMPAKEIKCVVRNFMIPLWILESIIVLIRPSRRIGDWIAGTKVVKTKHSRFNGIFYEIRNVDTKQWIFSLFLAVLYIWVLLEIYENVKFTFVHLLT